jgi:hypothetical protein
MMSNRCYQKSEADIYPVRIIYNFNNSQVTKVHPGHLFVEKGKKVEFTVRKTNVTILFPNEIFESSEKEKFKIIEIDDGGSKILKLKGDCSSGIYPYAIYCKTTHKFVEVDSPPSMIVENDD